MSSLTQISRLVIATSRITARLVANLCVVIIYIMLGLLATQILMRYFPGAPPSWTEELAIILFTWLVLLYATVGVQQKFHVTIETIPERRVRLRMLSDRLVALFIIGFGLVAIFGGTDYVLRTVGQKTAALQIPIDSLYLSVPVSGALFILHAVALLLDVGDTARTDEKMRQA